MVSQLDGWACQPIPRTTSKAETLLNWKVFRLTQNCQAVQRHQSARPIHTGRLHISSRKHWIPISFVDDDLDGNQSITRSRSSLAIVHSKTLRDPAYSHGWTRCRGQLINCWYTGLSLRRETLAWHYSTLATRLAYGFDRSQVGAECLDLDREGSHAVLRDIAPEQPNFAT
jgi:hypothetical protein